jgi:hypothetical protein
VHRRYCRQVLTAATNGTREPRVPPGCSRFHPRCGDPSRPRRRNVRICQRGLHTQRNSTRRPPGPSAARFPAAEQIFAELASVQSATVRRSDAGRRPAIAVELWGSLDAIQADLRGPVRQLLNRFLPPPAKTPNAQVRTRPATQSATMDTLRFSTLWPPSKGPRPRHGQRSTAS